MYGVIGVAAVVGGIWFYNRSRNTPNTPEADRPYNPYRWKFGGSRCLVQAPVF
jgi:hypothetical protein